MRVISLVALVCVSLFSIAGCGSDADSTPARVHPQSGGGDSGGGSSSSGGSAGGAGGTGGAAPAVIEAANVSISDASEIESETHIAAGPGGRLALAWIGISWLDSFIDYVVSTDGGNSFTTPAAVAMPDGYVASDPVLAADADGAFHVAFIAFKPGHTSMGIYVAQTEPDGTVFGPSVEISEPTTDFYDKPWITVTKSGAPLVTYAYGKVGSGWAANVATTPDGTTWKKSVLAGRHSAITPCVDPGTGAVFLAMAEQTFTGFRIVLARSDDDGQTWNTPVAVSESGQPAVATFQPMCVAFGGTVWVSYALGAGDATDPAVFPTVDRIVVAESVDGGQTVATRIDAQDTAAGALFMVPALARADGAVELGYYAGAADGDPAGSVRIARRPDGATDFDPSTVAHAPVLLDLSRGTDTWVGDYFGVAWRDGRTLLGYVDNASGASHVSFYSAKDP